MRAIVLAAAVLALGASAAGAAPPSRPADAQIDYRGFAALAAEVEPYRAARRVDYTTFQRLSRQKGAIILDARSPSAFARGHLAGAVNLPFSDFTAEKLAAVIGDPDRPILIYCNNNFSNDVAPVVVKAAPLALNIPTFINLYGYGYKNLYELADVLDFTDPAVAWERAAD